MSTAHRFRFSDAIVSTDWLADNLDNPAVRVFDCTTYLIYESGTGRPYRVESGKSDYERGHIPGSAFLDLQADLSDPASGFNFTMPQPADLASKAAEKGIGADFKIVLYSRKNMQWATRVWWMLRAIGFDAAAVLDGGFDKWATEGRTLSTDARHYPPAKLVANPRAGLFVDKDAIKAAIGDAGTCTINALGPDLHSGTNPRYGRPGRVPGSVNVPALALQDAKSLIFEAPDKVAATFAGVGADQSKRILIYCGGGIAATLDAFLLHQLGYQNIAVYDNSMSEWAKDESLPIERD